MSTPENPEAPAAGQQARSAGTSFAAPVSPLASSLAPEDRSGAAGAAPDDSPFEDPTTKHERYRTGAEVGRGGLGVVVHGWDAKLDRPVALKILAPELGGSEARFAREVRVTGRLQHPGIVPLYDAGKDAEGRPFYAMRLLPPGATLAERLAALEDPSDRLAFLPNLLSAVEAVAYAHAQGVVHRDLKPENILIGEFGETIVIDWGVAKEDGGPPEAATGGPRTEQAGQLTLEGELVGSPAYMAPEQAKGEPVDARADVFALGATLYRLLAGRPPYQGSSLDVLLRVAEARFPDIDAVASDAPEELKAMVRKATSREPSQRYKNASEFAEDLRRYQAGQLVFAHRYTWWALLWRWVQRHRAAVTVAGVAVILSSIAGAVALANVLSARKQAEAERAVAEERSRAITLVQARTSLDVDPTASVAWLKTYPSDGTEAPLARNLALEARERGVALHVFGGLGKRIETLVFSPDSSRLFALVDRGETSVLVAFDIRENRWLRADGNDFSPDLVVLPKQGWVAAATWGGTIEVYDRNLDKVRSVPVSKMGLVHVRPLGEAMVAAMDEADVLFVIDVKSGEVVRAHEGACRSISSSFGGKGFCLDANGRVLTFDQTGRASSRGWRVNHTSNLRPGLAVSGTGDSIVVGADDGSVTVGGFDDPELTALEAHHGAVTSVAFTRGLVVAAGRDGILSAHHRRERKLAWRKPFAAPLDLVVAAPSMDWMVALAQSGTIHFIADSGDEYAVFRQRDAPIRAAISPDERFLATSSAGELRIWPVPERPTTVSRHRSDVESVVFVPQKSSVVSASLDGELRLFDARSQQSFALGKSRHEIKRLWPTETRVFFFSTRSVGVYPLDQGAPLEVSLGGAEPIGGVLSRHGVLWVVLDDGSVRRWDGTGEVSVVHRRPLAPSEHATGAIAVSSFDDRVAFSVGEPTVHVLDGAHERAIVRRGGPPMFLALAPNSRLIVAERDGQVEVWSTDSRQLIQQLRLISPIRRLALHPSGNEFALGTASGPIHVVNLETWAQRVLEGNEQGVMNLAYSPDGRWLASSGLDKSVRAWDVTSGVPVFVRRHNGIVFSVAFSADGANLATGGWEQVARAVPFGVGASPSEVGPLAGLLSSLTTAVVVGKGETRSSYPGFVTE